MFSQKLLSILSIAPKDVEILLQVEPEKSLKPGDNFRPCKLEIFFNKNDEISTIIIYGIELVC